MAETKKSEESTKEEGEAPQQQAEVMEVDKEGSGAGAVAKKEVSSVLNLVE